MDIRVKSFARINEYVLGEDGLEEKKNEFRKWNHVFPFLEQYKKQGNWKVT